MAVAGMCRAPLDIHLVTGEAGTRGGDRALSYRRLDHQKARGSRSEPVPPPAGGPLRTSDLLVGSDQHDHRPGRGPDATRSASIAITMPAFMSQRARPRTETLPRSVPASWPERPHRPHRVHVGHHQERIGHRLTEIADHRCLLAPFADRRPDSRRADRRSGHPAAQCPPAAVGLSSSTSRRSSSRAVMPECTLALHRAADQILQLVVAELGEGRSTPRSTIRAASSRFPAITRRSAPRSCRQNQLVHLDVPRLADAVGAVGGLVLHRRVPPAVEVEDVVGGGQVEPGAAGLERQDEDGRAGVGSWKRSTIRHGPPAGRRRAGTAPTVEPVLGRCAASSRPCPRTA